MVHPLKNILNRLRWVAEEKPDEYLITYRHRGAPGDIKQVRASDIGKLGKSYFTLADDPDSEEVIIPFHRVLELRNIARDVVIWRSRKAL